MAWTGLATALNCLGRIEAAIDAYRRAEMLDPALGMATAGRAAALQSVGRHHEAEPVFRRALSLMPQDAMLRSGFVQTLRALEQPREAEAQARLTILLAPDIPLGHLALGAALADQGEVAAAQDAFRAGVALPPDNPEATLAVGMIRLLLGDYPAGWQGYQSRTVAGAGWPEGADLAGKRINVRPEQGLGDTLQFSRWLPMLVARGAVVGFDAPAPLRRLLAGLPGVAEGAIQLRPLERPDYSCALLDLGHLLAIRPAPAAKLPFVDPAAWAERMAPDGRLRVGLAWAGNPAHGNDRARSVGLAALAPVLAVPNCRFVAVQPRPAGALPPEIETPGFSDFGDTSGLMAHLDLVISVDSAPAHLAGALGGPVWVLLAAMPDWRWQLGRADSPWYPSARLYRQAWAGDWGAPVAADLARMARR